MVKETDKVTHGHRPHVLDPVYLTSYILIFGRKRVYDMLAMLLIDEGFIRDFEEIRALVVRNKAWDKPHDNKKDKRKTRFHNRLGHFLPPVK